MYRLAPALLLAFGILEAQSPKYGIGRSPSTEEIQRWDISIAPDGAGLPEGSGTAAQGREVYANRCSKCHGAKGEGRDSVPLAGGQGSLKSPKPLRTVGSYWPNSTTIWDYVNRAMPFKNPGVLSHDQVYAVTAYILFLNGIVAENTAMDAHSLPKVQMPNRNGFVTDPRPDVGKHAAAPR
jgi:mono/diheme cytochrome c family protein